MSSNRPWIDRILDRTWFEIGRRVECPGPPPTEDARDSATSSVSGTMEWPRACTALADGSWTSSGFRRRRAVRQVVETLAPSDARQFAKWIRTFNPGILDDEQIRRANDWGGPLQAPSWVLGTRSAWSPTSLRYLMHALWLNKSDFVRSSGTMVEVGVGFGGLAAMAALVSRASTMMVDLPEVERAARLQMKELGLSPYVLPQSAPDADSCFVSNYAFTELSRDTQDHYIEQFARHTRCGVIVSNASMFAEGIGGRNNESLVLRLRESGIPARLLSAAPILGPSDVLCANQIIFWNPRFNPDHGD